MYQVVRIRLLRHAGTHYWFEHPVEDGTTESDNDMSDSLRGDSHARKIRAVLLAWTSTHSGKRPPALDPRTVEAAGNAWRSAAVVMSSV